MTRPRCCGWRAGCWRRCPAGSLAIGVSFGGPVDATRGLVRLSHHVPGWEEIPLADQLQAETRRAGRGGQRRQRRRAGRMALRRGPGRGEPALRHDQHGDRRRLGAGRPHLGRRRRHGRRDRPHDRAARRRALRLRPARLRGGRGVRLGDRARRRRARLATDNRRKDEADRCWRWPAGALEAITAQMVAQAAETGDALAQAVLDEAARALGSGTGGRDQPDESAKRVVLGGGVTKAGERWWRTRARETRARPPLPNPAPKSCPPACGRRRALWGRHRAGGRPDS